MLAPKRRKRRRIQVAVAAVKVAVVAVAVVMVEEEVARYLLGIFPYVFEFMTDLLRTSRHYIT